MDVFAAELGFFGIIKESFKILSSEKNVFTNISLALLLPVAVIVQIVVVLSPLLSAEPSSPIRNALIAIVCVVGAIGSILLLLLSAAAVVTTAAQIYFKAPLSFIPIITFAATILKKLVVTFLWCLFLAFIFNLVAIALMLLVTVLLAGNTAGLIIVIVLGIVYIVGSVYLTVVFDVAKIVTVLEDEYGRSAISRSKNLVRGKEITAAFLVLVVAVVIAAVQAGLSAAEAAASGNLLVMILAGVGSCLVITVGCLVLQVFETVLYFVCKFRVNESVDVAAMAALLGTRFGQYAALKAEGLDV